MSDGPAKIDVLPHGGENLEVMAGADNYNGYLRQLVRRFSGSPDGAIDFGAGIGTFSDSLQLPKQSIHCVETEASSRVEIERQGFRAYGSLAELDTASAPYAFSLNVLEHIEDDAAALRELHRVLQPGGRLFVYVPAFQVLFTSMDAHVGHHRRYRRSQLVTLIQNAGFDVEKSAYTDVLGFFATLLFKLFDKPEPAPLNPALVRLYDRFVFPLSRLLSIPLAKVLGKNAYVVARKPANKQ
jgi:SAM-dependent methyltransferase